MSVRTLTVGLLLGVSGLIGSYGAGIVPADPNTAELSPLSGEETRELVGLLRAQVADLERAVRNREDEVSLLQMSIQAQSAYIRNLEAQVDTERTYCDRRVELAEASCSCPSKVMRKINVGLSFGIGALAGRGSCGF